MVVAFPPDGSQLVTSGYDGTIRFWDTHSGALRKERQLRAAATFIVFSPDGQRLFCQTSRTSAAWRDIPTFEVWDVEAGRQVANLPAHRTDLNNLTISADGRKIVTGGSDNVTLQWEVFPWKESEYLGTAGTDLKARIRAYADQYWRERLAAEAEAWNQQGPLWVNLVPFDRSSLPSRDPRTPSRLIDLSLHYNSRLDRPAVPSWTENVDNDLRNLPVGVADYAGVPFDARGVIQLRQRHEWGGIFRMIWNEWPVRVDGIPIAQRVRRLHLLHGTADRESDGAAIGVLVWHYADGQTRESEIIYGRHVRAWDVWDDPGLPSEARVGWEGTNPTIEDALGHHPPRRTGQGIRLYVATWDNPRPESEVVRLDYVSREVQSAPFLVAITVE